MHLQEWIYISVLALYCSVFLYASTLSIHHFTTS